ncbi:hypothetical protein B0H11DRAFT_2276716 [Mycena galericulata]|nr:hypothetical protein B0H11DRAFT_2276716 [Mycena galericulata]
MSPSALFWASWPTTLRSVDVVHRRARPNAYTICEARMPRGRAAGAFWHGWRPARARATRGSRMMRSGTTPSPAPTAAAATTLCLDPEYCDADVEYDSSAPPSRRGSSPPRSASEPDFEMNMPDGDDEDEDAPRRTSLASGL